MNDKPLRRRYAPKASLRSEALDTRYSISVQIESRYDGLLDGDRLARLAATVLQAEGVEGPVELGIVVTTDEEVHALNKQYLGHDYKTDVLSFGMDGEDTFVTPQERPKHLGEVVISYDRAAEQAPDYGHSASSEIETVLVHGILHLLGYNDLEEADREKMHARQQAILDFGF